MLFNHTNIYNRHIKDKSKTPYVYCQDEVNASKGCTSEFSYDQNALPCSGSEEIRKTDLLRIFHLKFARCCSLILLVTFSVFPRFLGTVEHFVNFFPLYNFVGHFKTLSATSFELNPLGAFTSSWQKTLIVFAFHLRYTIHRHTHQIHNSKFKSHIHIQISPHSHMTHISIYSTLYIKLI